MPKCWCIIQAALSEDVFGRAQNAQTQFMLKVSAGSLLSIQHIVVSNNSISGEWRPWSDCVGAQADLSIRCPFILEDTLSHGAAHMCKNSMKIPVFPHYTPVVYKWN